jgi:hypothetical protein
MRQSEAVGSHERYGASHSVQGTATDKVHATTFEHQTALINEFAFVLSVLFAGRMFYF